jgi:hypothetical protein
MYLILLTVTDKKQTRPLLRENVLHEQGRNCQTGTNVWPRVPEGARHQDRLIDRQS